MKESHDCKVVLVTGGSSGFEKTWVNYFASSGHHVYGTSRRAAFATNGSSSHLPLIIPMDVCDAASIEAAVAFILEREGRLDVLVNNAGIGLAGAIAQTSTEEAKAHCLRQTFSVFIVFVVAYSR